MEVPRPEWHDLSRRLECMEIRHRRLKRLVATSFVLISVGLLFAQRPSVQAATQDEPESKITAREFSLVDDSGVERASLVADGAGSVFLVLFDQEGKTRAALSVVHNLGPSLSFYDVDGQTRTIVGSTALVASHVVDSDGQVEKNTPSSMVLFDKDGQLILAHPLVRKVLKQNILYAVSGLQAGIRVMLVTK